ncbi:MAG: ABC transporter permease, partial [Candidatus Micrarchaeota archaeon]
MKALSAIKKEMLEILHDRTMLAVLLVFPVLVMIFMGSSFRSLEINGLPIGVAGPTDSAFAQTLFSGLNGSTAFKLQSFDSESSAMDAFRNGQLRAVIIVPEEFEQSLNEGRGATITIAVDNSDIALEQSVLAAMSSVVEASSADITKAYISAAWQDLEVLNRSASSLASEIDGTRAQMLSTKQSLDQVEQDIEELDIESLEGSLDDAEGDVSRLRSLISQQRESLQNASAQEEHLLNDTRLFLNNASFVLNESLATVQSAHVKLQNQSEGMEDAIDQLDLSIAGLQAIRAASSDPTINAALDLNIASLQSLRGSTQSQLLAAYDEMAELEMLNSTLNDFRLTLDDYSVQVEDASNAPDRMADFEAALNEADRTLSGLDTSFTNARSEIAKLKTLLVAVGAATEEVDSTIEDALDQMDSFESLMG